MTEKFKLCETGGWKATHYLFSELQSKAGRWYSGLDEPKKGLASWLQHLQSTPSYAQNSPLLDVDPVLKQAQTLVDVQQVLRRLGDLDVTADEYHERYEQLLEYIAQGMIRLYSELKLRLHN